MSALVDVLNKRHSQYVLDGNVTLSNDEIVKVIKDTAAAVPSAFNSNPQRMVIVFGEEHKALWNDIVLGALKNVTAEEQFAKTQEKIAGFAAAYGTVLFFDDTDVTKGLQENFPLYADNFPRWANEANGSLQLAVWTALAEAGLGASVQHYNPLIDDEVASRFEIPASWKLIAQMPFGHVVQSTGAENHGDINERVRVIGE